MTSHDNTYSRVVAWLKVVLPLTALAILSTLFLVSERRGTDATLPYSDEKLDQILRDQQITNPTYAGVTGDGSAIVLSADSAQPEPGGQGRGSASDVIGVIETPGGGRLDLSSARGVIDTGANLASLSGGVSLRSSTGYRIETDEIDAALDSAGLSTPGEIRATGPLGELTAGRMELTREGADYVLSFTKGVKLIYQPPRE